VTYLLDTNVCIEFIRGRNKGLIAKVEQYPATDIGLCSIVLAELTYGALNSPAPAQNLELVRDFATPFQSLPFDDVAAAEYGQLRLELQRAGTPIGSHDMLIAAIARAHGLIVVTHNQREFGRVPRLPTED
jgi:tRNA(fMet)-specific endonuclease VapC